MQATPVFLPLLQRQRAYDDRHIGLGANGPADSQPIHRRSSLEGRTNLVSDIVRQERLLANHPGASFSLREREKCRMCWWEAFWSSTV